MKNFIRVFSVLSLMFVCSAVSAYAQASYGSEVEVPFAFSVADRSYEAGTYIFKLRRMQSGGAALSITDPRSDRDQLVLVTASGDGVSKDMDLVFDIVDDKRIFRSINTPTGAFALLSRKPKREVAARAGSNVTEPAILGGSASLF
jgi:hypothetical protein